MNEAPRNGYEHFDELIAKLRADGYEYTAQRLQVLLRETAWTTSLELIGELGREILAFQRVTRSVTSEPQKLLRRCMKGFGQVWPLMYFKFRFVETLSLLWSPYH